MNGRWMEKFGFDTGKLTIITVERGRMVIELDINI
ncbi:type I addiction module toxin, SymE family [Erwinia aphidicola]|nr:type I addiction module toxin, SymE family [Erwinia aphidicola]